MDVNEDGLTPWPTLGVRFRDVIIDTTVCCNICREKVPLHCSMCHQGQE
jgi:hypothetical protein